jgi:topoisomerase-4 subunit A
VRRIYRLDIDELNAQIRNLEAEIKQVKFDLSNLNDFAIAYFENLLKKYGKGRERKSEIKVFEVIEAKHVAIANTRLYWNKDEGFIGTSLKRDEFLFECSDLDDIIAFTKGGVMKVVKVADKVFIGKDILYAAIFRKGDERTTYNMIYLDGKSGVSYAKRFNVTGVTRDKEYDLTKGSERSKVHYLSVNPNGEAEVVRVLLSPNCTARQKEFEFSFEEIEIKGRSSMGNQVTKYPVRTVKFKEAGVATLGSINVWFDDKFGRLNNDGKGIDLGAFDAEDRILVIYSDGTYEITDQEMTQRFDPEKVVLIERFDPERVITAVYLDSDKQQYNVKRFRIETNTLRTPFLFIKEGAGNVLEAVSTEEEPILIVNSGKGSQIRKAKFKLAKMVEVMGWKAVGAKLVDFSKSIEMEWEVKSDAQQQQMF